MAQTYNLSNTTPVAPANTVAVQWQNDNSNPPNVSGNVPSGVGGISNVVAKSLLTAQAAAITATTVFAIPSSGAGMYRVSFVANVTTAAGTGPIALGGTTGFQLKFTNANGDTVVKTTNPTTANISASNATTTSISGDVYGYCGASTNLQYIFGYTGGSGPAMVYDLAIFVEYLGS